MASCLTISVSPSSGGTAAARLGASAPEPLGWITSEAVISGGNYTCPSGSHLLLSIEEVNAIHLLPSQWTSQDGLTVGWSIALIWLSTAAVMFLAKIFKDGSDHEPTES